MNRNNIRFAAMSLMWSGANLPAEELSTWLDEVHLAGYVGVSYFDGELLRFRANGFFQQLADRDFALASVGYTLDCNTDHFKQVCDTMQSLGCQQLVTAGGLAKRGADMKEIADLLNQFGEIARGYDIFLSYHHHTGHLAETYAETERLTSLTNPDVFFIFLDVGHATKDFQDLGPVAHRARLFLEHFEGHIRFIEFKDWSPETDLATEIGAGKTDWPALFACLREQDCTGWITVEQNAPTPGKTAFESARASRDFIRDHFM